MQDLPFEQLLEGLQIGIANVRDSPVIEVGINPIKQTVTLASYANYGKVHNVGSRPEIFNVKSIIGFECCGHSVF
jgi:hypothetical protein